MVDSRPITILQNTPPGISMACGIACALHPPYTPTIRKRDLNTDLAAYFGLFTAAFLAATILPAQSEAVLALMIVAERYPVALLIGIASLGNVLGSVVNWGLGRGIEHYRDRRWFPVSPRTLDRAEHWYRRYGKWSLLASWVPIIGDPLTVVAGVLKVPFLTFLTLVTIAKTGRYLMLAFVTLGVI